MNERILITKKMDYHKVMSRAEFAIIHGGAGITNIGIMSWCPLLVKPFNGD